MPFSLNIDESTNKANKSILAMLVQYYFDVQNKVILRYLASISLKSCNAINIFYAIVSLIEGNRILWKNLINVKVC